MVTRYDLTEDVVSGVVDITPVPESHEGRFVSYEDYVALKNAIEYFFGCADWAINSDAILCADPRYKLREILGDDYL